MQEIDNKNEKDLLSIGLLFFFEWQKRTKKPLLFLSKKKQKYNSV